MKTMILAAFAVLGLSLGVACAQGLPAGSQAPSYGSQSFVDHHAGAANSAKGG